MNVAIDGVSLIVSAGSKRKAEIETKTESKTESKTETKPVYSLFNKTKVTKKGKAEEERVTTQINARMAPLSDVEAAAVAKALELPHDETKLVEKFNISISRRLMSSLINEKWLNDEVKYFIRSFLL